MIDTLGFLVTIPRKTYDRLIDRSILTQRIDKATGSVEFEYNNFHTHHSWNYKVMWKADTKSYIYDPAHKIPVLTEGAPYVRFEFSAPKIIWGHNLYSLDMSDAIVAAKLVRDAFMATYGVNIDPVREWYCYRIDSCANFVLHSEDQVRSYIRYLQKFDYPRRIKNLYEDTGIYFASRYNTLKVYSKGIEFKKHDMNRFLSEFEQKSLYNLAKKILRIEVEHKNSLRVVAEETKRRGYMYPCFHGYMRIYDLISHYDVRKNMEKVVKKFLSGSETKIMRSLDVFRMLKNSLGSRKANTYYSIYTLLITQGQKETRRQVSKSQFYKALSCFRELGISIVASDIEKVDIELSKGFPEDFSLNMNPDNKYYQLPLAA